VRSGAGGAGSAAAGGSAAAAPAAARSKELVPGAVVCGMGGLVVSIRANVGDRIEEGDVIATIEAMKMIREVGAPRGGVVQQILIAEGDLVAADDVLMVVH
jgi:biotin carboxyl carrier protein